MEKNSPDGSANPEKHENRKNNITNLAVYKIRRSLKSEGFDLITDKKGKLTLVLRFPGRQ